jgi:uncharacterized membrane protein YidH (DUF202 family)
MQFVTSIKNRVTTARQRIGEGVFSFGELLAQGLQVLVPGAGAGISFALGKLVIGVILTLICLGIIVRLTLRRKNVDKNIDQNASLFLKSVAFVLALGLSAGFVEMTNLPVRFNQQGFAFWYWAIVLVVITVTYRLLLQILSKMFSKKAKNTQATRLG